MTLFATSGTDTRLRRLAEHGKLRRIYRGIYTDDLITPIETQVRRELFALCAALAPGAVISHRSALEARPTPGGNFFLTGIYRRDLRLPSVTMRITEGPAPLPSDARIPTFLGDTYNASWARALLENLAESRGDPAERRTLGRAGVEAWLDRLIARDIDLQQVNGLRDQAREIAEPLGLQEQFKSLDQTIGALLGARKASNLTTRVARARATGRPYDAQRLELFNTLASYLNEHPLIVPAADSNADPQLQAFVESYFSNYIEGTEFEIEEAHDIVVKGRPLKYREDDSHDILGTHRAILESKAMPRIAQSHEEFVERLRHFNRQVIESRVDKQPGEFKTQANRAGNTYFVAPDLVLGTLERGFELIMAAGTPANKAALAMFVVVEVHPFTDGNGRSARVLMNEYLSAAGLTRIIVPTVYRDDYISALKALSSNAHPVPYDRMLTRAARFSRWIDFSKREACFKSLKDSNAMEQPQDAKLKFDYAGTAAGYAVETGPQGGD